MLKGNLSAFGLGQVLQSLAINHHTGTLSVTSPAGGQKFIYFVNGNISLFSHGKSETPRIGEVLVRLGKLTKDRLDEALERQKESRQMLGKVLLEENFVTKEAIVEAVQTKIREEVFELFLIEDGEFEFQQDYFPEHLFDSLQKAVRVTVNSNAVIMEALRRLDEWGIIGQEIRTLDEIFVRTGNDNSTAAGYEADVLALVDGRTSVQEISRTLYMTRFECCKALYNLAQEEVIRPLSAQEAIEGAEQEKKQGKADKAIVFLRFVTQLVPEEPRFFLELAKIFSKAGIEKDAQKVNLQALKIYFDQQDIESAAKVAESLPPNAEFQKRDLQILLQTFVALKNSKKAVWAGTLLAQAYQHDSENEKAVEVLESLISLDPADLNLKIQVATLLQKAGDVEHATKYFEEVANALERQKKIKDQIKILRLVVDLDPNRADVKQKISMLEALQQRLELGRKRRVTIAGGGLILIFVATIVPLLYEVKANELYSHAQRMEAIAMHTGDFVPARQVFEEFLKKYSFSTKVHDAQLALERLATIETGRLRTIEAEVESAKSRKQQEMIEEMNSLRDRIEGLLAQAKEAELARNYTEAHRWIGEAILLAAKVPNTYSLQLPVEVNSYPSGAEVQVDAENVGKTPLVLHYRPGTQRAFKLSRHGCVDLEEVVTLTAQQTLSFRLQRRPIQQFLLSSSFEQPLTTAGGVIVFASRDGNLSGLSPEKNEVVWQTPCGEFGDKSSRLLAAGGQVYFSRVEGGLVIVNAESGEARWVAREVRGPVFAPPAISADQKWLALAALHGEVALVDLQRLAVAARFTAESEVTTCPLFAGDFLIVGSADGYLYGYSVADKGLRFLREIGSAVTADPIEHDGRIFIGSANGSIHELDVEAQTLVWSKKLGDSPVVALASAAGRLFVGSSDGHIHLLRLPQKEFDPPLAGHDGELAGLHVSGKVLYASFGSGRVFAWHIERLEELWGWKADAEIRVPPLVVGANLFVASSSGTLQMLEVLE
jgi:outer membrane protein assembly factor BamB/tetratricopeptide (TPR) repeat protein